ncbi:DUF1649-domain-containing protein [Punctularia strigosozonata HHB-11173 SS5]|uniref:DUF1649-domain-containing protein n=1 Tax=Punctularia strigosozonata (strain HHB-11173) TaxID=741275 RepID=UPI0004416DF0|nr:DUF1649-domain-containing protein [Punctularia strigosozonata HHB-11173 SS5]EIN06411.1 DUF1649-domain-containing protein [Punctularia strigosozonata HHB-11173 SS5]
MNPPYPNISIDLTLDRPNGKDVLTAVLHSILFHRLFGCVKPQAFEVLDVTMPGVSDPDIEQIIRDKVDFFYKAVEGEPTKRGQVTSSFTKKQRKSSWFSVYASSEEVPWEQWTITATIQSLSSRQKAGNDAELSQTLQKTLTTILMHTSSEQGRSAVPLITSASGISPFPLKITVKVGSAEG